MVSNWGWNLIRIKRYNLLYVDNSVIAYNSIFDVHVEDDIYNYHNNLSTTYNVVNVVNDHLMILTIV